MLDENKRQNDPAYGKILKRLRLGQLTAEDANVLNSRVWHPQDSSSQVNKDLLRALELSQCTFPIAVHSNENRHAMNWIMLSEYVKINNISPPILCIANFERSRKSAPLTPNQLDELLRLGDEKLDRLPPINALSVGVPVQITANIAVHLGVANGSLGTIVGFDFEENCVFSESTVRGARVYIASELPTVVYVDLPCMKKGHRLSCVPKTLGDTVFPIVPLQKPWVQVQLSKRHFSLEVTQLPFSMAYASTTYKLQGATVGALFIPEIRGRGCKTTSLYVMLSRIRSLKSLFLLRPLTLHDICFSNQVPS